MHAHFNVHSSCILHTMDLGEPRWKGRQFADIAEACPMSLVIKQLQTYLLQCATPASLRGCNALVVAGSELANLLNRSCFGQPISTFETEKQWFQLGPEEAFYLAHALKCLVILGPDETPKTEEELWDYMRYSRAGFPYLYKAYSHLRSKNWVVRPGLQYGVDFVAYRHHPALVHSEYAVLVMKEGDPAMDQRLHMWSDWQCALRVSGGVAKALLVLSIDGEKESSTSLSCLEQFMVEERMITRWVPELSREISYNQDESGPKKCSSNNKV